MMAFGKIIVCGDYEGDLKAIVDKPKFVGMGVLVGG